MSGNFDYVTYRPLSGEARDSVAPGFDAANGHDDDDDDDALLDVDATDVLDSRDLTLRMDTEDESDRDSDSVSLTPPSSSPSQTLISNLQRHLSSRRNKLILVLLVFLLVALAVIIYCAVVLS